MKNSANHPRERVRQAVFLGGLEDAVGTPVPATLVATEELGNLKERSDTQVLGNEPCDAQYHHEQAEPQQGKGDGGGKARAHHADFYRAKSGLGKLAHGITYSVHSTPPAKLVMNTTTLLYEFVKTTDTHKRLAAANAFLKSFLRGVATPPPQNLLEQAARLALSLEGSPEAAWNIFPTLVYPYFPLLPPKTRELWMYLLPRGGPTPVSQLPKHSLVRVPTHKVLVVGRIQAVQDDEVTIMVGNACTVVTVFPYYPVYLLALPDGPRVPIGGKTQRCYLVPTPK